MYLKFILILFSSDWLGPPSPPSPPGGGAPPCPWYNLLTIGVAVSSSFFFSAFSSSVVASACESNHAIASSTAFSRVVLSSSDNLPPNLSLSLIWFFREYV